MVSSARTLPAAAPTLNVAIPQSSVELAADLNLDNASELLPAQPQLPPLHPPPHLPLTLHADLMPRTSYARSSQELMDLGFAVALTTFVALVKTPAEDCARLSTEM